MEEKYRLTENDIKDRQKYLSKTIKYGILFIVFILLPKVLPLPAGVGIVRELSIPVWLTMLAFTIVNFIKYIIRQPSYYEKEQKKREEKAKKFYINNPSKFAHIKAMIDEMAEKTGRYGHNIMNMKADDADDDEFFSIGAFTDAQYYKKTGTFYEVFVCRYYNMIIISHVNPFDILKASLAFNLADELDSYVLIDLLLEDLGKINKKFHYQYDARRDGGYLVVVPKGNVSLSSLGGKDARMTFRTEFGVEHIDFALMSNESYELFANVIR